MTVIEQCYHEDKSKWYIANNERQLHQNYASNGLFVSGYVEWNSNSAVWFFTMSIMLYATLMYTQPNKYNGVRKKWNNNRKQS